MKSATLKEKLMIIFPVLLMTFCRTATLSYVFAFLKGKYAFILVIGIILMTLLCAVPYILKYGQMAILGATVSVFGPCLIVSDFTNYYLITGLSSTFFSMSVLAFLTMMVYFDQKSIVVKEKYWPKSFNMTNYTLSDSSFMELVKDDPFFNSVAFLMGLWIISLGSVVYLHYFLNPVFKLRFSKWVFPCLRITLFLLAYLILIPIIVVWIIINCLFYLLNKCPDILCCCLGCITVIPAIILALNCCLQKCFDITWLGVNMTDSNSVQHIFAPALHLKIELWNSLDIGSIWNSEEEQWKSLIEQVVNILNYQEFEDLNKKAKDETGETLLNYIVTSGKYHLFKVYTLKIYFLFTYNNYIYNKQITECFEFLWRTVQ